MPYEPLAQPFCDNNTQQFGSRKPGGCCSSLKLKNIERFLIVTHGLFPLFTIPKNNVCSNLFLRNMVGA